VSPSFVPRNPAFAEVVVESFGRQSLMATLGARLTHVGPGEIDIEMPFAPHLCQQNGFLHAGAITSIADSANGYAAYTLAPPETDVLAVEFKINLLEPARGERFVARGRVLRPGRTITACQAEVYAMAESGETLIAVMLSTIIERGRGKEVRSSRTVVNETQADR
jgi:uncharacterized protein (TIGR00369 family)